MKDDGHGISMDMVSHGHLVNTLAVHVFLQELCIVGYEQGASDIRLDETM